MSKRANIAFIILQIFCIVAGGVIALVLNLAGYQPKPTNGGLIYSVVVFTLLAIVVIIEIISDIKIHDSTVHTVLTALALLINYVFSHDMQGILNPSQNPVFATADEIINFVSYAAIVLAHAYLLNYLYNLKINKITGGALITYSVLVCVLYGVLTIFGMQFIAYIAFAPAVIWFLAKAYIALAKNKGADSTFNIIVAIFAAATGSQTTAFLSLFKITANQPYGIITTYSLLIVMLFAAVYVLFMLRTQREALKASEYKLQSEQLKSRILREQINPHFVFNSLILVKEAYHDDIGRGDLAMSYFSRQLRANVEAMNMDCIPFARELDNIENYVGLANMKRDKPVNIIYDIGCEEFSVPTLSLQVLVENAVKYAKTEEIDGGYIAVTSEKTANGVVVTVTDNGTGFDVNAVKDASCGLRNARDRFKLLLGADFTVESEIGRGTKITITILDDNKGCKNGAD